MSKQIHMSTEALDFFNKNLGLSKEDVEEVVSDLNGEATTVVTSNDDTTSAPDLEEPTDIAKEPDIDEVNNELATKEDPASIEELLEEETMSDDEVQEMVESTPNTLDDENTEIQEDEETGEIEVVETNDDAAIDSIDADSAGAGAAEVEGGLSEPVDEDGDPDPSNDENEPGIDPEQAIECLIASREEDIVITKGDAEITIDEANKVSVDTANSNPDAGTDNSADDNVETPETPEADNNDNGGEGDNGGDAGEGAPDANAGGDDQSNESLNPSTISRFFL